MAIRTGVGLGIVACLVMNPVYAQIKLTHKLVDFIDGKSFGIDGDTIGLMLQVVHETKKLRDGKSTKNGFQGNYAFAWATSNAKKYLIQLQNAHDEVPVVTVTEYMPATAHFGKTYTLDKGHAALAFEGTINLYTLNREKATAEFRGEFDRLTLGQLQKIALEDTEKQSVCSMRALEEGWDVNQAECMRACLEVFKNAFAAKAVTYLESARGAKEQMLVLMKESCEKRNRMDSFILRWADAPEGAETSLAEKEIVTFKQFDCFLTDLLNFMEDLSYSCPKAFAQFVAKYRNKKSAAGA